MSLGRHRQRARAAAIKEGEDAFQASLFTYLYIKYWFLCVYALASNTIHTQSEQNPIVLLLGRYRQRARAPTLKEGEDALSVYHFFFKDPTPNTTYTQANTILLYRP